MLQDSPKTHYVKDLVLNLITISILLCGHKDI